MTHDLAGSGAGGGPPGGPGSAELGIRGAQVQTQAQTQGRAHERSSNGDPDPEDDITSSRSPSPALTVSNGSGRVGHVAMTLPDRLPTAEPEAAVHTSSSPSSTHSVNLTHSPTSPLLAPDSLVPLSSTLMTTLGKGNRAMSSTSSLPSTSGLSIGSGSVAAPGVPLVPSPAPKAEFGFGLLQAEEELKKALSGKDRMFVLMLGKEFEAFIGRVTRAEYTARMPLAAPAADLDLAPSKRIDVAAASKFHRMLTYKLAEWYGLRAMPGADGSMVVGVLGTLDERATTLKISTLKPEAAAPQTQQFRIMQRGAPSSAGDEDGVSRGTSASGEDGGESSASGPRAKTLEERTLAYALARKRIIGDDELRDTDAAPATSAGGASAVAGSASASASASQPRSRQASRFGDDDDEVDPVPRRTYPPDFEYVYPSLYRPTQEAASVLTPSSHAGVAAPPQPISTGAPYSLGGMPPAYPGYMGGMGYDQRQYAMGAYSGAAYGQGMAYGQWPQMGGPGMMPVSGQMMMPSMGQWLPPDMVAPLQQPAQQPTMMPIIPQGMPYTSNYSYPTSGPTLAQPTPMRPGMDPLSSTASSISSRSYQDVHSRPHSRGSTTSTRSAASSVRLGAMYAGGAQAYGGGFRQKAVKPAQGSFGSAKSLGFEPTKRSGRQSPASTTSSSRSSRRTSSIHTSSIHITQPQPGQHPLPQRPDWAANNVPYHPSAAVAETNALDFPPLHRSGGSGVTAAAGAASGGAATASAEPMQIEKVKMRLPNGAWSSAAPRAFQHEQAPHVQHTVHAHQQQHMQQQHMQQQQQQQQAQAYQYQPQETLIDIPPQSHQHMHQQHHTHSHSHLHSSTHTHTPAHHNPKPPVPVPDIDPDFPRRIPSARTPRLYDPSAPRPARQSPAQAQASQAPTPPVSVAPPVVVPSTPSPAPVSAPAAAVSAPVPVAAPSPTPPVPSVSAPSASASPAPPHLAPSPAPASAPAQTPDAEDLEERVAGLSVKAGTPRVTSYAKIVRRDT